MNYITVSIWHKLILICFLIKGINGHSENIMSVVKQYNLTDQPINISLNPEEERNVTEIDNTTDFIIKLQFIINEQKLSPFLRDEIYNNHERHNITIKDLIELWKLRDTALSDFLSMLGIPSALYTLDEFRQILYIANLTFNQYYSEMKKNIPETKQLQLTLKVLDIDPAAFSSSITFGTEDEIYEVLSKGSYTWEKFEKVKNNTGLDIPESTKNIILNQILSKSIRELVLDLQKFPMINKGIYEEIWNRTNVTTYDIYKVESLRRIVNAIHEDLVENTTFGIAFSEHEIILHKDILRNLDKLNDIVSVFGESSSNHYIYDNLTSVKGLTENTSIFWSNNSLGANIEIMKQILNGSLLNCSYIDNDLTENNVTFIHIIQKGITVAVNNDVHFNLGNPLICDRKLVGLAVTNSEDNIFLFDTFFENSEEISNSSNSLFIHSHVILFVILVYNSLF